MPVIAPSAQLALLLFFSALFGFVIRYSTLRFKVGCVVMTTLLIGELMRGHIAMCIFRTYRRCTLLPFGRLQVVSRPTHELSW